MLDWWNEYESNTASAKWHDIKFIVKQIDPTYCWYPDDPKDESILNSILENPSSMVSYLKSGHGLSSNEKTELRDYIADPANQDELKKQLKTVKNLILKARPTFRAGTASKIQNLIRNCDYNSGDLEDMIDSEYKDRNSRMYGGSNYKSTEASAVISLILKVINQLYGFSVWSSIVKNDDECARAIACADIRLDAEDQTYEQFLDDANNLKFKINKTGNATSDTDEVASSSFTTYYKNDFEVICYKNDEEIFHELIPNVTVATDYYSGGW